MPSASPTKRTKQRKQVTPPHLRLSLVRQAAGLTLDDLIERIQKRTGKTYTRGALSAVENGHRGASTEMLDAIALAYGLAPGSFTTDYLPRQSRRNDEVA